MKALSLPALTKAQPQSSICNLYLSALRLAKFVLSEWSVAFILWISLVKQIGRWLMGMPGSLDHFDELSLEEPCSNVF